jgi:adenosylcobinamide-phosphate guanylyltransferase
MDALIMAGGLAQRLGYGEKSCVDLGGQPLISYIISALQNAKYVDKIYVSVTKATPQTKILLENNFKDLKVIEAAEGNYVQDMIFSIKAAGVIGPVMVVMCDLPLVESDIIDDVILKYDQCENPALSVYVPIALCKKMGTRPDTVFHKDTKLIVPTGVNILDASDIDNEQSDYNYILNDMRLVMNVNTPEDLEKCRELIKEK